MTQDGTYPPVHFAEKGRPLKYTPKALAEKFLEYLKWAERNPIEIKTSVDSVSTKGETYGSTTTEQKPRLISIGGFLVYIGATRFWWSELDRSKRDFSNVKAIIREYCEEYQKEMASAGVFNGNIISRLLGLADKKQIEGGEKPINLELADPAALAGLKHALETGAQPRKQEE